ncbi:DgyrCDS14108 [Dimorphilus gyrociliatus]|uniref:DgyrCDS14108 n=1 Tax=Dimorphilus gyrociliatus TaxID=2664684 RepID=A0A7I8WCQ2_9ANNE|nr:DgyrCDS14108 [Dimorphilus gyrociliatus]
MSNQEENSLKKVINLWSGIAVVFGNIVGSGIFISPKGVLLHSGSVGLSLIFWALCGVISMLGALTFAELGTLIHKSGGMFAYIQAAFGNLIAFIYLWATLVIILPTTTAIIGQLCGQYILQPIFSDCQVPDLPPKLVAACAIALLVVINSLKVEYATRIQNFFSILKLLSLACIFIGGLVNLCFGHTENLQNGFAKSTTSPSEIALALYVGMFSYGGWYTLNFLTEEMEKPEKNLPKAIVIGLTMVTAIYILTNISYFSVLSADELLKSDAVAMVNTTSYTIIAFNKLMDFFLHKKSFMEKLLPKAKLLISIAVACSVFGSLNGLILASSRVYFVGARDGLLPNIVSCLHDKRRTPLPAVTLQGLLSIIMLFAGDIFKLINYVIFIDSVAFFATTLALFFLRRKMPDAPRPIKVPIIIPIIFLIICVFLIFVPIIVKPDTVLVSIIVLALAVPAYIIGVMWEKKPKIYKVYMTNLTIFLQKLFLLCPQKNTS